MPAANLRRIAGGELPSRVADGLFWVARYAERSDSIVRLLRTLLIGVTDAIQPWRYRDAEPILNLAAWRELVPMIDHPGLVPADLRWSRPPCSTRPPERGHRQFPAADQRRQAAARPHAP